ncbi:MAG TPA: hypothetical protein VFG21_01030 [Xanthomonadaceae bacterium]|nr:hypothetical protein [Xanthomonadaceae bacterium]
MNRDGKLTSRSASGVLGVYRRSLYRARMGRRWHRLHVGAGAPFIARLAARHGQLAVLAWRRGEPVALCTLRRDGRRLEPVPA